MVKVAKSPNKAIIFTLSNVGSKQVVSAFAKDINTSANEGKTKRGRPVTNPRKKSDAVFNVRTYTKAKTGIWNIDTVDGSSSRNLNSRELAKKLAEYQDRDSLTPIYVQNVTQFKSSSSPQTGAKPISLTSVYLSNNTADQINDQLDPNTNYIRVVPISKQAKVEDTAKKQFDLGNLPTEQVEIVNRGQILVKDSTSKSGSAFSVYANNMAELNKLFSLIDKLAITSNPKIKTNIASEPSTRPAKKSTSKLAK